MAQDARQGSMGEDTVDRSGEESLSGLTKQLRGAAARVQINATIVNYFIDLVPAVSQDPARAAVMEALAGDNIAPIAASAAAAAVEADSACTGGGGQHAAAPDAPPYQGHRFDTLGPVYKDPAVVELLRTKYADKMEEAVSRDRAKSVDNLKRTA